MNQDEVESQLSAMFDGELPTAECELLTRRVDREDKLRARWSRYALIGAAMRCEPVATARGDFAARVSRAVDQAIVEQSSRNRRRDRSRYVWQGAMAAGLVGAVAGFSLLLLRNVALAPGMPMPVLRQTAAVLPVLASASRAALALRTAAAGAVAASAVREPYSYVTPANPAGDPSGLRTELVDYMVAHSQYSTPLMQSDLLSALISGEDAADDGVHTLDAVGAANDAGAPSSGRPAAIPIAPAAHSSAAAGDADAPTAVPATSR